MGPGCMLSITRAISPYTRVAAKNRCDRFEARLYVGKAIPSGGRKGVTADTANQSTAL